MLTPGERAGLQDLTVRTASAALGSIAVDEDGGKGSLVESVTVMAGVGTLKRGGTIRDSNVEAIGTAPRSAASTRTTRP